MIVSTSLDTEADALYIQILRGRVARTEMLDEWTLVDVDEDGAPLGIEVIHPARQWPLADFLNRYQVSDDLMMILKQLAPAATRGRRHAYESAQSDIGTTAVSIAL
jgi:uncharacterized protein YuzE